MSLYYEAAEVLTNTENAGGSFKNRIYRNKSLKSSPASLYALVSEASKWSLVLKDVIERSRLLKEERKVRLSSCGKMAIGSLLPLFHARIDCWNQKRRLKANHAVSSLLQSSPSFSRMTSSSPKAASPQTQTTRSS